MGGQHVQRLAEARLQVHFKAGQLEERLDAALFDAEIQIAFRRGLPPGIGPEQIQRVYAVPGGDGRGEAGREIARCDEDQGDDEGEGREENASDDSGLPPLFGREHEVGADAAQNDFVPFTEEELASIKKAGEKEILTPE